ncbi:MAG: hypothetical protein II365_05110, partial [Clostridia bacterium]|nr:hypothetical protein [Clostridia bacterium]
CLQKKRRHNSCFSVGLATIGVCVFGAVYFGSRTFLYADRGIYEQEYSKKAIDITGIELMPVEPNVCLGNGEHGFECYCDECDYCLFCFPELDKKTK